MLATFLLVACVAICSSLPAREKINVEETIHEVEDLIKNNPKLPRLTRGEILDIIDNLEKIDENNLHEGHKENNRDQKAIMVVMPYSPSQNGDNEALYTKPPVTHIIGENKPAFTKKPYLRVTSPNPIVSVSTSISQVTQRRQVSTTTATPSSTTTKVSATRLRSKSTPYTTAGSTRYPGSKYSVSTVNPIRFSAIPSTTILPFKGIDGTKFSAMPGTTTVIPFKPLRRRTTKSPKYPNHKYPEDTNASSSIVPNQGINIITAPQLDAKTKHKKATTTPSTLIEDMQLPQNFQNVLKNIDLLIKDDPKYESLSPLPNKIMSNQENIRDIIASLEAQTTTTAPDIQQVANNLSPDMQQLLMTFGLIPDPNPTTTTQTIDIAPNSETKPESYTNFKPFPMGANGNVDDGMEQLLAQFGLGTKERRQKAIEPSKLENQKLTSPNIKDILDNLGIKYKNKPSKQHVFNPADAQFATIEEIQKLNQLTDVVKQLERLNGTATDDDLRHIDIDGIKQLVQSLNVPLDEQSGPNPIDFDAGLNKNEVKRQQSTTESPAEKPSISDLEDSFGGSSDTVTEAATTPAPPRRTGFYYLVDWNTFFDIDDQKGKRVNLRFQPTIGDPKRFFSVNVP